jgi:hypothetical protein
MASQVSGRRRSVIAAAMAIALTALCAGCSSAEDEDQAPAACLTTSDAYIKALAPAPGEVRLEGDTPISDCLVPNQGGGELGQIGRQMIVAATKLNGEARTDPTGPAAVQLGYLIGAVQRGEDSIHADLVRRLNAAARFSPGGNGLLPASFERTFGQGYAAGHESG